MDPLTEWIALPLPRPGVDAPQGCVTIALPWSMDVVHEPPPSHTSRSPRPTPNPKPRYLNLFTKTPRSGLVQRAGAANPHACGTSVTIPSVAGSRARSKWGCLIADVENNHMTTQPCAADASWERLDGLEKRAKELMAVQLLPFEEAFRLSYEAGVIVPVLRANSKAIIDVRCGALFYKRVLNDLRGVHVLLHRGYTSQAAAVAASLYENALAAICLFSSQTNIDALLKSDGGEIPWSPIQMAKMVIGYEGKIQGSTEFENQWRALYAHYVWLCQCKHPTMQTMLHDTTATTLKEGYVIMALPNVHDEDLTYKAMISIHSLARTHEAIQAFASALGYKDSLPDDYSFAERFTKAKESAWNAFVPFLNAQNPATIKRTWFVKKHPPVN